MKSKKKVNEKVVYTHDGAFGAPCPALGSGPEPIDRRFMNDYRKVALHDQEDTSELSILGPLRPVMK